MHGHPRTALRTVTPTPCDALQRRRGRRGAEGLGFGDPVTESRLLAYARRVTPDPEEMRELVSEAWARAWLEAGARPATSLAVESLIGHLREVCRVRVAAQRFQVRLEMAGRVESEPSGGAEESERGLLYDCARGWVWDLPKRQRDAVWFHMLLGFDLEDTAHAMGCALSTAKTHLYRGMATLRTRGAGWLQSRADSV
jgi:DNA-directed RNA polymerase specialized sigma24 family protein